MFAHYRNCVVEQSKQTRAYILTFINWFCVEGISEKLENAAANVSGNIETAPQANSNAEPNNNSEAEDCEAVDCEADLMPEEQLDSDNSDTAGLYEVNPRDRVEAQNQAYQPGQLPR